VIICLEEKHREVIESKGMSIIEFKRTLYNAKKHIENVLECINKIGDKISKAWSILAEKFIDAVDSVKMFIETIRDVYNYPVSIRYKFVKILSKCTGLQMCKLWKMTRHTWLARSCC